MERDQLDEVPESKRLTFYKDMVSAQNQQTFKNDVNLHERAYLQLHSITWISVYI